uniref:Uncharacterized protein n=1 Tax=Magallana gigas TaxID=29159 RepID=K1RHK6_MAGGI
MPKSEGDITLQGFPVTEGHIFRCCTCFSFEYHCVNIAWINEPIEVSAPKASCPLANETAEIVSSCPQTHEELGKAAAKKNL